jgi:opacity protein-like surface antigen
MRRAISILVILICFASAGRAQFRVVPNKPYSTINSSPGYITINEITGALGLAGKTAPFSKYFMGFTTLHGYQVNKNFLFALGTGLSFYESGLLVPLFLDVRMAFNVGKISPYVFADGGLLINFSDFNDTKLFINPGAGVRYTLTSNMAANIGAGFISQVDGKVRETFINLKAGIVYKFK